MKTALYDDHKALGAKFVDFGGWEMPLLYSSVLHEHQTVRSSVGIFDVSHMGRVEIRGRDAEALLDRLSTNQIAGKPDYSATYTVWCLPNGSCLDDLIVYRFNHERFFVIFNAANRQKDLLHLQTYAANLDVQIIDYFTDGGIIAVQGPWANELLTEVFPHAAILKPMQFQELAYDEGMIIVSSTGYTGAGGFEIFATNATIKKLWNQLLIIGKHLEIAPIGLGARDTLRLEMGYALYGHELSESISPLESVAAWAVKLNKNEFIGKEALIHDEGTPKGRFAQGIELLDPGIVREGYFVFKDGEEIGVVTSGGFSPTLGKSIAITLLNTHYPLGSVVEVAIRKHLCKAKIVEMPFIKKVKNEIHRNT